MGKEGDLWDDYALVKAFDNAISKYKKMHGISGVTEGEMAEADNGSNESYSNTEHVQNGDNIYTDVETTSKIGETADSLHLLQIKEDPPLEFDSFKHVGSSNTQTGNLARTSENPAVESGPSRNHMISPNKQSQNEAAWYGQEEYNQLLSKYYEIEDQRQKILHQLNQYSNWNYQNPVSGESTSEECQASLPQPYDTVTCYCSYGCQNWIVPCNSLPDCCSGGTCSDRSCGAISKDAHKGNSTCHEESDFVKTAMDAAKRAASSVIQDTSTQANIFTNEGKDKELGTGIADSTEGGKPGTDLAVVLNAWYSAGFYTGKYISEQQFAEKR